MAATKVLHRAETRGMANHGWLISRHSFSFASYYNPDRMHFGMLRVLNDDVVAGGMGFGSHPHDNMEIISIPLEGELEHKDNMGNATVIRKGDIQVMSAGTGVSHSEYNKNKNEVVKFLQIWIFPNKKNVTPRYDQLSLREEDRLNKWHQILSPNPNDEGVWIHQNAWFHIASFDKDQAVTYSMKDTSNGVYIFILNGSVDVEGERLSDRDGLGIWHQSEIKLEIISKSEILLMEVPMMMK